MILNLLPYFQLVLVFALAYVITLFCCRAVLVTNAVQYYIAHKAVDNTLLTITGSWFGNAAMYCLSVSILVTTLVAFEKFGG